ncbi:hypothetical protein GOODEAATRI_032848, partial [Goodea atripinnis]
LYNRSLSPYYVSMPGERVPFICSIEKTGMRHCWDIPPYHEDGNTCLLAAPQLDIPGDLATATNVSGCVNWNTYYSVCRSMGENPNMGCINFDNIGYAWIAIFQVNHLLQLSYQLSHFWSQTQACHSITLPIYTILPKVFTCQPSPTELQRYPFLIHRVYYAVSPPFAA